ncbi:MAG TPA: hypothetical protein VMS17_31865 [Gemmataceae bacterium]|nr:hypothetical protein [Gemmataceae bacterium]
MHSRSALFAVAVGLLSAGCSMLENGACVTAYRLRESIEDAAECRRDKRWAEECWNHVRLTDPCVPHSGDYAEGFRAGFADYLYRGGAGEPPPLPPQKYRALCYQTPQGYQAIEDWFAGFRRGAAEAHQGGYRDWVTGPSSLRPAAVAPPPVEAPLPAAPPPQAVEELPPPKAGPAKEEKQSAAPPSPPVVAQVALQSAAPREEKRSVVPPPPPIAALAASAPTAPKEDIRTIVPPPPMTAPIVLQPAPAPKRPAPAADVQAHFHPETNHWTIVWNRPNGAGSTSMSEEPFSEMIHRLTNQGGEAPSAGGKHRVVIDDGREVKTLTIDDESFEGLSAYLGWYCEGAGQ